ncbi:MAG: dihydrofolate reductase [Flammeovirgaceae bacterium]|nr:dihydrofolate reductase [Flammeovirgaceae bacterium]MBR09814.1 dihydrofolate reductase [Rickettsiales bacterium]
MRAIIYHVATSLDGFIAKEDGSTQEFIETGEHVEDYLNQLKDYDTTIMGRNTYEYGYAYGLQPGQPAYPHMNHYLVSDTLNFENQHEQIHVVRKNNLIETIEALKQEIGSPIYLCGGGQLAKTMLENRLIDELIIKLNPIFLGSGIHLFGGCCEGFELSQIQRITYENGVQMIHYKLIYQEEMVAV